MNNSVFGKTMEDVRNRINYILSRNEKQVEKILSDPCLNRSKILILETEENNGLVGFEMEKGKVELNKTIYVGFRIFDLSKLHMQQFYYDVLKPFYNEKVQLCYTDTDSFVLNIKQKMFMKILENQN